MFVATLVIANRSEACEVTYALHNDAFHGGWTLGYDDYRTYGGYRTLECERFYLLNQFSGFTNRTDEQRLDSYLTEVGWRLWVEKIGWLRLNGGAFLTGNFLGEQGQNELNSITGHPKVDFDYDHGFRAHFMAGLSGRVYALQKRAAKVGVEWDTWIGPGLSRARLVLFGTFGKQNATMTLSTGWQREYLDNAPTVNLGFEREAGAVHSFETRFGHMYTRIKVAGEHGVGVFGLTFFTDHKEENRFERSDAKFSAGITITPFESYFFSYRHPLRPLADNLYVNANTVFGAYPRTRVDLFPDVRGQSQQFDAGLTYAPLSIGDLFRAEGQVYAGLGVRTDTIYTRETRESVTIPNLTLEVASTLSVGSFWNFHKNARHGFRIAYRIDVPFGDGELEAPGQRFDLGEIRHTVLLGLSADVDLNDLH